VREIVPIIQSAAEWNMEPSALQHCGAGKHGVNISLIYRHIPINPYKLEESHTLYNYYTSLHPIRRYDVVQIHA
jgi:hypothetical protein